MAHGAVLCYNFSTGAVDDGGPSDSQHHKKDGGDHFKGLQQTVRMGRAVKRETHRQELMRGRERAMVSRTVRGEWRTVRNGERREEELFRKSRRVWGRV